MMDTNNHILIHRFLRVAGKYPDRPALHFSDRTYTYSELLQVAAAYKNTVLQLREPSPVVAVLAEHCLDAYAGILGILLAGKGYLPLNPRFPVQRNGYMLRKSGSRSIIASLECAEKLTELLHEKDLSLTFISRNDGLATLMPAGMSFIKVEDTGGMETSAVEVGEDSTAYLLFTSGSTGNPKGVAVSNRNVTAYLDNLQEMFSFVPEDRFTQTFDLTFDLSVHDLFVCWSAGACLCVPDDNSSFGLSRYLKQVRPTVWFSVPSVAMLMERMRLLRESAFPFIRLSFFCGEALFADAATAWKAAAPASTVVNLYGPTEATIAVSAYVLPEKAGDAKVRNGVVSIGRLFPGHSHLLAGEVTGRGVLCLTGPQVVRGYFEDELLTKTSFFDYGTPPVQYYNTGDLAEQDASGDLYFRGRSDSEVKVYGYRVNLQEIDHVLNSSQNIKQAVTLYLATPSGEYKLVSFIDPAREKDDIPAILMHCRQKLPTYMVPEKIIFVDAMPLNPNGKVDRQTLAKIFREHHE
jgi:amino acid adenylation domain-containing protein